MPDKLSQSEEILKSAGIFDEIKGKESVLIPITKAVINSKTMDRNTIIYRLAMMIYHSKTTAGAEIIESIGDPGFIYLNLMQDREMEALFHKLLKKRPLLPTVEFAKTFICFVIGAYLFYRATS